VSYGLNKSKYKPLGLFLSFQLHAVASTLDQREWYYLQITLSTTRQARHAPTTSQYLESLVSIFNYYKGHRSVIFSYE